METEALEGSMHGVNEKLVRESHNPLVAILSYLAIRCAAFRVRLILQ